jgi:hypothetical protein
VAGVDRQPTVGEREVAGNEVLGVAAIGVGPADRVGVLVDPVDMAAVNRQPDRGLERGEEVLGVGAVQVGRPEVVA